MNEKESQKAWDDYHAKIKSRRLSEAGIINSELEANGITAETDLALDFNFFTQNEVGANSIQAQLGENYQMSVSKDDDYWYISGTSRPYAVNMSTDQHVAWVEFMNDVAVAHGCIFSAWSITDPVSKSVWSNEDIESELD